MLCRLSIQDVAVIDSATITLDGGFSVLTGETGAGKSLIIDAITMVLGGRTGRDIIRHGARCAVAEAAFFCQHPLADEDGMLILRRELYADGRNLCSINGQMVTVAGLREAAEGLLAIHGQHDTEQLLHKASHLAYVDTFGDTAALLSAYQELYKEKNMLVSEIESLSADEKEKSSRLEILSFWIDEIEAADPEIGEDEELEEKRLRLRHAEKIQKGIMMAYAALCGEEVSARDLLSDAARALESVGDYSPRLAHQAEEIRDMLYKTEELADALSEEEVENDSGALSEIEDRLNVLHKLKSKYGHTIEDVLAYLDTIRAERASMENSDARLASLKEKLAETEAELDKAAAMLTACRKKAACAIADKMEKELAALDMAKTTFSVQIESKAYGETGGDSIEFFISTNPAEPQKPLAKIASGGELSRVCLALKTVLAFYGTAEDTHSQTMIFDEIDTGISGRAAQRVGEKLAALAEKRQILCVTHLPQIAARATAQFKIDKTETDDRFVTTVARLEKSGRIEEIARMISGDRVSEQTLKTAEEMLR